MHQEQLRRMITTKEYPRTRIDGASRQISSWESATSTTCTLQVRSRKMRGEDRYDTFGWVLFSWAVAAHQQNFRDLIEKTGVLFAPAYAFQSGRVCRWVHYKRRFLLRLLSSSVMLRSYGDRTQSSILFLLQYGRSNARCLLWLLKQSFHPSCVLQPQAFSKTRLHAAPVFGPYGFIRQMARVPLKLRIVSIWRQCLRNVAIHASYT